MAKHLWLVACVVALSNTALVGCGGDDDGGADPEPDSGTPMAGSGGSAGMSGAGGMSGGGGAGGMGAISVPCGTATCMGAAPLPIPIPIPMAAPCCLDEDNGTCGVMMGSTCEPPPPPPVPDPTCPGLTVFGMMIPGCCIDGMCGVDASLLGMGCRENGAAAGGVGMFGGLITIPPPGPCGVVDGDGGTDSDGGS